MITDTILPVILGCATTGGVIACLWLREPASFASRMLVLAMAALAGDALCTGFSLHAQHSLQVVVWQRSGMMARTVALLSLTLFSLTYARVNFREFLRWWRWPLSLIGAVLVGLAVSGWNDCVTTLRLSENDSGWRLGLGRSGSFTLSLQLVLAVAALMNMERTLQAAVGTLRWKVKFVTLGAGVVLAAQIYTITQTLILGAVTPLLGEINLAAMVAGGALVIASLFRAQLGDGDLYISTHLIFRSLTILIVGGYLVAVGGAAKLFFDKGDDCTFLPFKFLLLLAALVALGIALLSDRLRQRAKLLLSRHLLRPRYDHRQVWATLIGRTSQAETAPSFCQETTNWISETFEIMSVTIWLIDESVAKLSFGGSTRGPESQAITPTGANIHSLTRGLRANGDLIDLESTTGDWIELIKHLSPDMFHLGGPQLCLPLLAGQDMVGMMVMTDRVQRLPLTAEELDLIRTIAAHVAARLYVFRLSEQVLQAKQMEAFQAMSAFFVHDLKNTASTLSLMLQNLPTHFDDPAFRHDALRAVAKSVDRINAIIAKLALFRQGMAITPTPADLNTVVTATLAEMTVPAGIDVHHALRPLPAIPLDCEQIRKVLLNLLLNACDAMPDGGSLVVETELHEPWVLLTVADNGIGMSVDFLRRSLFHPFKTSKPQGLGIGLFHAKVIVESHGGRIEVESEPEKGSQFKVWLPVKGGTHESATTRRG